MTRLILLLLCGLGALCAAGETPKAEAILDRYLEVTGGKAAYEKIHSEVSKGTMDLAGRGIKGALLSYQAEPNLEYTMVELEGIGKVESGSDGDVFWERSAITGPRIKDGDEREEISRAAIFNPHLHWRKIYEKAEVGGAESVEGEECVKLVLTPKAGSPVTEWYSKKTGLLMKQSSVHKTSMGEIPAEALLKDYKPVGGLTMPFTRVSKFAGQEIQIHLDSIEFNGEIPKDKFNLPEEIKTLLRKNGATNEKK